MKCYPVTVSNPIPLTYERYKYRNALLPALAKANVKAQGIQCMNNTHQLGLSWIMYATDNRDVLVQNQNLGGPGGVPGSWATGFLTWTLAPDNTNVACLTDPTYAKPGEYISKNKNIFKCQADHFVSPYPLRNGITERVRSVSMNFYVSAVASTSPSGVVYRKTADFRKLPTSKDWVFVDEHPDSINDVAMYTDMTSPTGVDLPASDHNGACGFSFADGHSEIKKWIAAGTIKPVRYVDWTATGFNAASDPKDIRWVQERTTEKL